MKLFGGITKKLIQHIFTLAIQDIDRKYNISMDNNPKEQLLIHSKNNINMIFII